MMQEILLDQFERLGMWSRGNQRAPHKPLLVIYALARWARGNQADIPFGDVNRDLTKLLKEFGPPRKAQHPEYPFWWLQTDGIWVVRSRANLQKYPSSAGPSKGELLSVDARAGFTEDVKAALDHDPNLVNRIVARLLERHFPESIRPDILSAVGMVLGPFEQKRDPQFRQKVLTAYEWRCAVCGFDVRLGSMSIALDAAHIRWHQAGGPAIETNGLSLCTLHHKTFDLGAFTLRPDGMVLVSDQANGSDGFRETLLRFHGTLLRAPQRPEHRADAGYLKWHRREVFKGAPRHLPAQ